MTHIIALSIFIIGYLLISLEHKIHISKSAVALATGGFLWLLVSLANTPHFDEALSHSASEIFSIIIFLLAAMSLVEILVHYKFFDVLRGKLYTLNLSERKQFIALSALAFILSGVIDNLTATIVMVQIARKFISKENLLRTTAAIVISANAGGAFSPIGDVTTIMLWLADKFTASQIIIRGFLPALAIEIVALFMMYKKIQPSSFDVKNEIVVSLTTSEKIIVSLVFMSFALPVLMNIFGLPPYVGLLIGLGIVWLIIDLLKQIRPTQTHLDAAIEQFIQKTDLSSIKFFIGILLAVSALNSLGLLEILSSKLYGSDPSVFRIGIGNVLLGMISSILDNVPLTAIAIDILNAPITSLWILLALTVGTGGSLLIIGSAAGVVAMGMVKELNFSRYLRIAFVPALISYFAGIAVWTIQFFVFPPYF